MLNAWASIKSTGVHFQNWNADSLPNSFACRVIGTLVTLVKPRVLKKVLRMKRLFRLVVQLSGLLLAAPALAQGPDWQGVSGRVQINAPPRIVWEAVHHERAADPDLSYSHVLQQKGNRLLLEQKFNSLPVIGEAVCLMVQEETPLKRIDYKLVKSDKFKDMAGSWVLTEMPNGATQLELYSLLDTGLPYSQGVINTVLQDKINKRLTRVKTAAEAGPVAPPEHT